MHLMTIIDAFKKSLRAKILLGYFVVIGILMLVGLWTVLSSIAINRAVEAITIDSYRSLAAVHGMLNSLDKMNMAQSEMLLGNDTAGNEELYLEADKGFRKSLSDAFRNITYPGEETALNDITDFYDSYFNGMTNTRAFILAGDEQEAGLRHKEAVNAYNQLMLKLEELYTINQDYMVKSTDNARSITSRAINSASLVSLIGLIVALYLGYKVSDVIIAPTKLLTESARKVAQGDLSTVAKVGSEDEIGILAKEFNHMTGRLKEYEEANVDKLVTEQRKSEAIIESIADPIIVLDKNMYCQKVNKAAQTVFGHGGESCLGKHLMEFMDDKVVLEAAQKCLETNRVPSFEGTKTIISVRNGDDSKYFRVEAAPFSATGAKAQGVILYFADVTYFKEVDQLKTDFVSTASHEFRTPLASMVLASELLLEEKAGDLTEKQKKLTGIIREDCSRLQELVSELLDISKLEAGKMEFHIVPVSLPDVLTSASVSLVPLFKDKDVELAIDDASAMPEVEADFKKLILVLNNLLMNALRYTDAGGSVRVGAKAEDGFVRVSVTDTGIGIPMSMQKKVFEKFFQGRWDEKHRTGGAGMGLALVKEIVEAMSGRIELESEEGRGSKFSFTLKAASKPSKGGEGRS